jgi:hypothetical protein
MQVGNNRRFLNTAQTDEPMLSERNWLVVSGTLQVESSYDFQN